MWATLKWGEPTGVRHGTRPQGGLLVADQSLHESAAWSLCGHWPNIYVTYSGRISCQPHDAPVGLPPPPA
jgi:hypothetical protein